MIREEAPAHLLPKVCFVSNADLQDIEAAYERMLKSDVKYRFVIDMATLKQAA